MIVMTKNEKEEKKRKEEKNDLFYFFVFLYSLISISFIFSKFFINIKYIFL